MREGEDRLAQIRALVAAVDVGSLSRAADMLGIDASSLSRRVTRLETQLGVQLLLRTTRSLMTTEAGTAYVEQARKIMDDLANIDTAARAYASEPTGTLRVHAPATFGHHRVVPHIGHFVTTFPKVRLQLTLLDSVPDFADEGIDVAIQMGEPSHPDFIVRLLLRNRRVLVASPDYLASRSLPMRPDDLKEHNCLILSHFLPRDGWTLERQSERAYVAVGGSLRVNSGDAVFSAALQGQGIALLSLFLVEEAVADGRLCVVLPDWQDPRADVFAVIPPQKFVARHVRSFIDHLVATVPRDGCAVSP